VNLVDETSVLVSFHLMVPPLAGPLPLQVNVLPIRVAVYVPTSGLARVTVHPSCVMTVVG
jgi:hypothetical protein